MSCKARTALSVCGGRANRSWPGDAGVLQALALEVREHLLRGGLTNWKALAGKSWSDRGMSVRSGPSHAVDAYLKVGSAIGLTGWTRVQSK